MTKYVIEDRKTGEYFKYFESGEAIFVKDLDEAMSFDYKFDLVALDFQSRLKHRHGIDTVIKDFIIHE